MKWMPCRHCGGSGYQGPYEQCPWCDGRGGRYSIKRGEVRTSGKLDGSEPISFRTRIE